tara:strand:+ start:190 stop:996 length:807 start_codon:yes stop_codon:yes gene_type:complete
MTENSHFIIHFLFALYNLKSYILIMIFKIPHSKFGTIEADVIDNKLVINKVYHFEEIKWDLTYKGYDLWKYDTYFAIYCKDNQYIGYGLKNPYQDRSVFVEVKFSKKPNRNIINAESPQSISRSAWQIYNNTTYDYNKINNAFVEGKFYQVLTDAEKLEKDKLKKENWNKATCSVCHRLIQLNGKLIWDHGYTMEGFRNGSCSGVNYQSWEKSPEGKIDLIKGIKNYIENNKKITPQEVKSLTLMIEEHQKMVDEWKPAKTPKELQDV